MNGMESRGGGRQHRCQSTKCVKQVGIALDEGVYGAMESKRRRIADGLSNSEEESSKVVLRQTGPGEREAWTMSMSCTEQRAEIPQEPRKDRRGSTLVRMCYELQCNTGHLRYWCYLWEMRVKDQGAAHMKAALKYWKRIMRKLQTRICSKQLAHKRLSSKVVVNQFYVIMLWKAFVNWLISSESHKGIKQKFHQLLFWQLLWRKTTKALKKERRRKKPVEEIQSENIRPKVGK